MDEIDETRNMQPCPSASDEHTHQGAVATLHLNSVKVVPDAGSDPRTTTLNLKGDHDYCGR